MFMLATLARSPVDRTRMCWFLAESLLAYRVKVKKMGFEIERNIIGNYATYSVN
jgi:hypothetical protein